MEIRTIDFAAFENGSPEQKKKLGDLVTDALRKQGFLKVINHGIPKTMIADLFGWSRKFFNLPDVVKQKAPHPPTPTPNRGYSGVGMENTSIHGNLGKENGEASKPVVDMKECFDQGAADDELYDNIWLPEPDIPGFRKFMESYFDECFQCQLQLLEALALGLGLEKNTFYQLHDRKENELRLTHYPAIETRQLQDGSKTRISEHSDFGTITLLFQDSVGGLEVEREM